MESIEYKHSAPHIHANDALCKTAHLLVISVQHEYKTSAHAANALTSYRVSKIQDFIVNQLFFQVSVWLFFQEVATHVQFYLKSS